MIVTSNPGKSPIDSIDHGLALGFDKATFESWTRRDSPVCSYMNLVQILAALLAKILVGRAFSAENANASTVLPDFANVALNKEASNFVGEVYSGKNFGVRAVDGRRAGVVLRATETADCLVLLVLKVLATIDHVYIFASRNSFGVVDLSAFASPS